tara:strand:+ start:80 stop:754 length:675 start_codon:yes stop_codon:yes gene_type:complete
MIFRIFAILFFFISCDLSNDNNLDLEIKGLKKGKVILYKVINDSTDIIIDSATVYGSNKIKLKNNIKEPGFLKIGLITNKKQAEKTFKFFAEPNKMVLTTSLDKFGISPIVKGSKNDSIWREFLTYKNEFSYKQNLIWKSKVEMVQIGNKDSLLKLEKLQNTYENIQKSYIATFAIRNSKYEVSPYIAISHFNQSNLLDTIYKSLSKDVKKSKYGKDLKKLISL